MTYLAELPELAELSLAATSVGDQGLKPLGKLKELRRLALMETKVTSIGLKHLIHLPELQNLALNGDHITDAAGVHLAKITSLRNLGITSKNFGDKGLRKLYTLKKLEALQLYGTAVTERGIREFCIAVPGCKVYSDFGERQGPPKRKFRIPAPHDQPGPLAEAIPRTWPDRNAIEWLIERRDSPHFASTGLLSVASDFTGTLVITQ